jgi:hypothetical protein
MKTWQVLGSIGSICVVIGLLCNVGPLFAKQEVPDSEDRG